MSENLGLVRAHSPSLSCYDIHMHVELSAAAQERVESLVRDGAYPSVEAAIEAAVEKLEHPDFAGIDVDAAQRRVDADIEAGRVHDVTPEFLEQIRSRVEDRIRRRQPAK